MSVSADNFIEAMAYGMIALAKTDQGFLRDATINAMYRS